jgi:hypothetical protein
MSVENGTEKMLHKRLKIFKTTKGAENTEIHGGFSLRVRNFNSVYLRALRVLCGFKIPKRVIQVETDALFQAYFRDTPLTGQAAFVGFFCLFFRSKNYHRRNFVIAGL